MFQLRQKYVTLVKNILNIFNTVIIIVSKLLVTLVFFFFMIYSDQSKRQFRTRVIKVIFFQTIETKILNMPNLSDQKWFFALN